ncbi:hypothetical protein [Erwinia piriflorinigrans]|uniref:Uncharacterized protein n=1 Tax=Erwinia piriflorinigrans CFBP 5888 TaxID=1161919 RepID=V5ZCD3_9GAMM|nr:hypothetical protein [Erwinia piriflorinigrans]CCG88586.1 hypothetical protein EPIR_3223 [Erwinia piriflorinigrans CFBP 5888]
MPKADNVFVNTSDEQSYELEDWLYRNGFSKKQENVDALKKIINTKIKKGITAKNITWDELNDALESDPKWFESLVAIGK